MKRHVSKPLDNTAPHRVFDHPLPSDFPWPFWFAQVSPHRRGLWLIACFTGRTKCFVVDLLDNGQNVSVWKMDSRKGSEASPTHSDLIKILPQVSFIHREHGGTLKIGTLRSQPHMHLIWWIFIGYIICPYDSSKSSKYLPHLSEGHVRALEEHFALASCHCWVKDLWHFREAFWVLRVLTLESSYVTKNDLHIFFHFWHVRQWSVLLCIRDSFNDLQQKSTTSCASTRLFFVVDGTGFELSTAILSIGRRQFRGTMYIIWFWGLLKNVPSFLSENLEWTSLIYLQ